MISREQALQIKVGDYVVHTIGNKDLELVTTIEHNTHGVRGDDEDYCRINGYYWHYDDIHTYYVAGIDPYDLVAEDLKLIEAYGWYRDESSIYDHIFSKPIDEEYIYSLIYNYFEHREMEIIKEDSRGVGEVKYEGSVTKEVLEQYGR
jgi:hypothetical protein